MNIQIEVRKDTLGVESYQHLELEIEESEYSLQDTIILAQDKIKAVIISAYEYTVG